MARAQTRTLLSLDRFSTILGMHPLHFNQVQINGIPACEDAILQHAWQGQGRVSREDIASAIALAEANVGRELGYDVAPKWHVDDLVKVDAWSWSGQASRGQLIGGGVEALSLISAGAGVTYSSKFSSGPDLSYNEIATVDVTTSVTDPDEIAVFYPISIIDDYGVVAGQVSEYAWQIKPIKVQIGVPAAGQARITFSRHQAVIPELLEEWVSGEVDGLDNTAFLTTVDVYRHYNDPSTQVEFRYKSSCCICDSGCAQCTYSTTDGCLLITDYRRGFVSLTPSTWDGSAHIFNLDEVICERPSGAALNYKAGLLNGLSPGSDLEQIIAHYALSLLGQSICSCSHINNKFDYYSEDFAAVSATSSESAFPSQAWRQNPLGTTRAAINAWEYVCLHALGRRVKTT